MIDLHMHTTASDGKLSPKELIDLAIEEGLEAIAITDHDTISAVEAGLEYAKGKDIEVVPGIETKCYEPEHGFEEIEVVGLFIDPKDKGLANFSQEAKKERVRQKKKMIEKLQLLGFDITLEEVQASVKDSIGRPHIARVLVKKYPEKVPTVRDAFDKYLAFGKPAYVRREKRFGLKDAINVTKKAGGITFLAHPGIFPKEKALQAIDFFKSLGGQGIETYYPYHIIVPSLHLDEKENSELIKSFQQKAKELGMLESGGSDFHGGERDTINTVKIPYSVLEKIKEAKE